MTPEREDEERERMAVTGVILAAVVGSAIAIGAWWATKPQKLASAPAVATVAAAAAAPAAAEPAPAAAAEPAPAAAEPAPAAAEAAPAAAAEAPAADAAAGAQAAAPAKEVLSTVYFAVSSSAIPADAKDSIAKVAERLKAETGLKLHLSGYHDKTGSAEKNAELAKKRAFAVRDALVALGVPEAQLEMDKPAASEFSKDPKEDRRVELNLQK